MKESIEVGDAFRGVEEGICNTVILLVILSENTYAYYNKKSGWRLVDNGPLSQYAKDALLNEEYYEKLT